MAASLNSVKDSGKKNCQISISGNFEEGEQALDDVRNYRIMKALINPN